MTVQAIVLRTANYRDYDRILTLFAFGEGRISAAARACRRIKSPLLNIAVPFVSGEFVLTERQGRYTVKSCDVAQAHYPLREDSLRLAHAAFIAALCEEVVQPGQPSDELYRLLLSALAHLSFAEAPPESVSLPFLVRLLDDQGIGPILDRCSVCGGGIGAAPRFPARGMGVVCAVCAPYGEATHPDVIAQCEVARHGPFEPIIGGTASAFEVLCDYAESRLEKRFRALAMIRRLT